VPRRKGGFASQEQKLDDRPLEERTIARLLALDNIPQPGLHDLPVQLIDPNPYQARRDFTDLDELADVIRAQGFTSRLRVRPHPTKEDRFQLIYGERRLRAAALAGLTRVPVEIVEHSDLEMVEIGLAENIQRRDLTPLEEARALRAVMDAHRYSQVQMAKRLGKSAGYVQNRLDLLRAPEDVQEMVAARPDTLGAARTLARIKDDTKREQLVAEVMDGSLTGEQARARVLHLIDPEPLPRIPQSLAYVEQTGLLREVNRLMSTFIRWGKTLDRASPEGARLFASYLREGLLPAAEDLARKAEAIADGEEPQ